MIGRTDGNLRPAVLQINNLLSIKRAIQKGVGIGVLPDYIVEKDSTLVRLLPEMELPSFDTFFCYTEGIKNAAKLHVFEIFFSRKRVRGRIRRAISTFSEKFFFPILCCFAA